MEILNIPMAILHVFFIPMIAVFVYYKRNDKRIVSDGELVVFYAMFASIVVTITKIIASVILKLFAVRLKIDSTYFAVIEMLVAFLLPYIIEACKKDFEIKCEIKKKDESR